MQTVIIQTLKQGRIAPIALTTAIPTLLSTLIFTLIFTLTTLTIATLLMPSQVLAAEQIVLKYNIFQKSIPVADLENFANTGKVSRTLRPYLRASGQRPGQLRRTLNRQVDVNAVTIDRVLNSFAGEFVLDQMSEYIHTASRQGDKQAMRSALTLSASRDNQISLIEVLKNYPTQELHVDGDHLVESYNQLQALAGRVEDLIPGLRLPRFF